MKSEELLNTINQIANNLPNTNNSESIISNESLNIVKGHPQFLKIFRNITFFSYLFIFFKYMTFMFYNIFVSLIIFKSKIYNKKINSDILIISHLVNVNKKKNILAKDFYFSEFENNKNIKNKKKFKIFLNHKNFYKYGFYNKNTIVLQNYTSFVFSILILFKLFFLFIKFFIFNFNFDSKKSNIIKIIALEFLSPKTFRNLIINHNLKLLLSKSEIKKIFITFEGFAWERLLCKIVKDKNDKTKIYAYQFAGLTKHQNSIFQKIHKKFLPHIILTVGKINYGILKKKFSKVYIVGSSRGVLTKNIKRKKIRKKNQCLVLPEGIDSECKKLINFSLKCAKENPKIFFTIRFHPMTNVSKLLSAVGSSCDINDLQNVTISKKSLMKDIKNSVVCFYRGSTSAVTAAQFGVIPLYINIDKEELNIDPMYKINDSKLYLKDSNEFDKTKLYFSNIKKVKKFADKYYEQFDQKKLTNILKLKQ